MNHYDAAVRGSNVEQSHVRNSPARTTQCQNYGRLEYTGKFANAQQWLHASVTQGYRTL